MTPTMSSSVLGSCTKIKSVLYQDIICASEDSGTGIAPGKRKLKGCMGTVKKGYSTTISLKQKQVQPAPNPWDTH